MPRCRITVEVKWVKSSFSHCLFCGRVIRFSKLVSSGYLIALTFIRKFWRFSGEHALNPPCFLLDFLILGYYVQSHVNTSLWHSSCTKSFVCGFKQALMCRQVVQFIQYFQWGKISSQSREELFQGQCLVWKEEVQKHHQQSFPLSYALENIWICLK